MSTEQPYTDAEVEELLRVYFHDYEWEELTERNLDFARGEIRKAIDGDVTAHEYTLVRAAFALMRRAAVYEPSERALTRSPLAASIKRQGLSANDAAELFEEALHGERAHHTEIVARLTGPMTFRLEPAQEFALGAEAMRRRVLAAAALIVRRTLIERASAIRALSLTPSAAPDPLLARIPAAARDIAGYLRAKGMTDDAIVAEIERHRATRAPEEPR